MATPSAAQFYEYCKIPYDEKWGYIWGQMGAVWTAEKQAKLKETYEKDPKKNAKYKTAVEYGSKWIGKRVIDCSGLIRWAMLKFMISVYHGSNSLWDKNLSHKGKIVKGMKLPIGAVIFTGTDTDKPHVGVYDGATYVIEAQGTKTGVTRTKLSSVKWKYWGLLKGLVYDFVPGETVEAVPAITGAPVSLADHPLVVRGSKHHEFVKEMQKLLTKAGYSLPKFGADGDFGAETLKALKAFQKDHGLKADGKCGPLTWAELLKE